jgi:hypothetical protein
MKTTIKELYAIKCGRRGFLPFTIAYSEKAAIFQYMKHEFRTFTSCTGVTDTDIMDLWEKELEYEVLECLPITIQITEVQKK